jgi:hypothetical protein
MVGVSRWRNGKETVSLQKKKKRIKGWGCALVHSGSYKSFGMAETRMCAENDGTGIEDAG